MLDAPRVKSLILALTTRSYIPRSGKRYTPKSMDFRDGNRIRKTTCLAQNLGGFPSVASVDRAVQVRWTAVSIVLNQMGIGMESFGAPAKLL